MRLKISIYALLLLWSQFGHAASSANTDARSIYQNSSSEIRVEQIAPQIRKSYLNMGATAATTPKETRDAILGAIEVAYHPKRFQQHIIDEFNLSLDATDQADILNWLNSPFGRKVSLLQAMTLIDSNKTGISTTIDSARAKRQPIKTKKLIDTVDRASMASELQLDITINQIAASSFAANAKLSDALTNDHALFYAATIARSTELSTLNQSYTISMLTNAYHELTDQELSALISFWGSPTGSKYAFALRAGINKAFDLANIQFNDEITNIIENEGITTAVSEQ